LPLLKFKPSYVHPNSRILSIVTSLILIGEKNSWK